MKVISPSEFFSFVWPRKLLTNENLELRYIDRKDNQVHRKFSSSVTNFLERAAKYSAYEVYFGVSTRYQHGGKKRDCYRTRCVWMDFDGAKLSDADIRPTPNIVVESGGGLHLYWILESPYLIRGERWVDIEAINRGLCTKFGGDNAAIDASRILRVPGFLNHKYTPPRIVKAYLIHDRWYTPASFKARGLHEEKTIEAESIPLGDGKIITSLSEVLRKHLREPNNKDYEGDYSRQDSAAVTAMLSAGISKEDCYATFVASPRGKHAAARKEGHLEDYLTRTISKAASWLASGNSNGNGNHKPMGPSSIIVNFGGKKPDEELREGINSRKAYEFPVQRTNWIWPGYVPAEKITILAGDPGMGKSTLVLDLISRISRGSLLPTGGRSIVGTTTIVSGEDAPQDTILPRLIAADADIRRVEIMDVVYKDETKRLLSLPTDMQDLYDFVIRTRSRLVVIDPIAAFMDRGLDPYKDHDIRMVMTPLEKLAEEARCAILIIAHFNKKEEATALHRIGGSIGFVGAARSVLAVASTQNKDRNVMFSVKSNLTRKPPALAYETKSRRKMRREDGQWKGEESIASSCIKWHGEISFDQSSRTISDKKRENTDAGDFLKQLILESDMAVEDIMREAKDAGVSSSLLKRARADLGVKAVKKRDGRYWWQWNPEAVS